MKCRNLVAAGAGLAMLLLAGSRAAAQDYRFGASWNVGGTFFTPLNAGAAAANGAAAADIKLDPGWILGVQFEEWFGSGRAGWRVNGALTQRPLQLSGQSRDIGLWMVDADALLRLLPATPDRTVNAYIAAGAGLVKYGLGTGRILAWEDANATFPGTNKARFAVVGAFGVDVVTALRWDGEPVGFRIEVADHVALSAPFEPLQGADFDPVHNIRVVLGVFTGFGLLR